MMLKNSFTNMQAKITKTWIMYNKPNDHNFSHVGLLLAFRLHKHINVLTTTNVYQYIT